MQLVVLARPREQQGYLAPRIHAFSNLPFDDAAGRADADVPDGFWTLQRRKTSEIALHQRLDCLEVDRPDEHEREVARVGEPLLVKRQGAIQAHLWQQRRRQRPRPQMPLTD